MKNTFSKAEPYFFLLVCLLNALPVLLYRFFPTMDGPAHLYNSTLILDMLGDNALHDFYRLNILPVPNWIGHFFLMLFDLVLPAWLAEKVLLLGYMLLLPLSFRGLTKHFGNTWSSYIIFPFTYCLLFVLGFYNLSLSLIFLFFTITYWLKHQDNLNVRSTLALFGLITGAFFSHVFIYAILLLTLFLFAVQSFISNYETQGFSGFVRKNLYLLGASILSLVFFFRFMATSQLPSTDEQMPFYELVKWIEDVRPLIALDYDYERSFTRVIFYLLVALSGMIAYQRLRKADFADGFSLKKIAQSGVFQATDVFAVVTVLLLTLYIKVPNGAGAGMMSDRFCLLFFFFFITWVATQPLPKRVMLPVAIVVLFITGNLVNFYKDPVKDMNRVAIELEKAGEHIEPYSSVLPINRSGHWLMPHISNYAGINRPIVMLENYEANLDWFPINWNMEKLPRLQFGNADSSPCVWWKTLHEAEPRPIEYVLVFGNEKMDENCQAHYDQMIAEYYEPVYSSPDYRLELFKLKR